MIAGIDVHKKMLAVVIRRQSEQVQYEQRRFGTTRAEIQHLEAWLRARAVEEVVMESTAQYWRPVWYGMEAHFKLHLSHPLQTRAPRGRKRDFRDARRLVDRLSAGDLEESFIPAAEQRSWRWLARTRVDLQRKIARVRNQVEGVLEEGGIRLAAVVTDLFGTSGWSMPERMAAGIAAFGAAGLFGAGGLAPAGLLAAASAATLSACCARSRSASTSPCGRASASTATGARSSSSSCPNATSTAP